MFDLIERIREKPRAQRQVIAFSIAGVITGIIFLLWAVSFFTSLQTVKGDKVETNNSFSFDKFTDSFNEVSETFRESVDIIKDQIEDTSLQSDEIIPTNIDVINNQDTITQEEKEATQIKIKEEKKPENETTSSGVEIIQVE